MLSFGGYHLHLHLNKKDSFLIGFMVDDQQHFV